MNNRLIIFGGWNGKVALNDVFILEIESKTWTELPTFQHSPVPRNNHASTVLENRLLIHGGHDGSKWLDDLWALDLSSYPEQQPTWHRLQPSGQPPAARACHSLSRVGRKIYLLGGYDGSRCFGDLGILDFDTFTWIQPSVSGKAPQARNAHAMTVVGRQLFLFARI